MSRILWNWKPCLPRLKGKHVKWTPNTHRRAPNAPWGKK